MELIKSNNGPRKFKSLAIVDGDCTAILLNITVDNCASYVLLDGKKLESGILKSVPNSEGKMQIETLYEAFLSNCFTGEKLKEARDLLGVKGVWDS